MLIPQMIILATPMFKQQLLRQQKTIGEQLSLARQGQGKSIRELATALKISAHHLESLETGRYDKLPSAVYTRHYAQIYAKALRLQWDVLSDQFEQEIAVYSRGNHAPAARMAVKSSYPGTGSVKKALIIPRVIRLGLLSICILLLALYFVWQLVTLLTPPILVISYPTQDVMVTEPKITVTGRTQPEATVRINGQEIPVQPDGGFSEPIYLHRGLNTIHISTKSKLSQEYAEVRNILYNDSIQD